MRSFLSGPIRPAALSASQEANELRKSSPSALPLTRNVCSQHFILLWGPWPLLQTHLTAARCWYPTPSVATASTTRRSTAAATGTDDLRLLIVGSLL
ncbi:hypothetical protein AMTR_s00047p00155610 [Amborella trichopoda]|uniref:Uncharacterized protein n=1 Tax=Amborella trichopoda TaxID=13333 RepID=U5CWT1_AMBTC|nr:hypothetical protein AMTR_s00047p00155610 [Amborella trichopoda]